MRRISRLLAPKPPLNPILEIERRVIKANYAELAKLPEEYLNLFRRGCAAADKGQLIEAKNYLQQARQLLPKENSKEIAFIQSEIDRLPPQIESSSTSFWHLRNVRVIAPLGVGIGTIYLSK